MRIIVTLLLLSVKRRRLGLSPRSSVGVLALGDINCSDLMSTNLFALVFAKLRNNLKSTGDLQLASCGF